MPTKQLSAFYSYKFVPSAFRSVDLTGTQNWPLERQIQATEMVSAMRILPLVRTFIVGASSLLLGCTQNRPTSQAGLDPCNLPMYDHVVVVVEENKNVSDINSRTAPFIDKMAVEGITLSDMHAEAHPSMRNYYWLFSGSDNDVSWTDRVPRNITSASNLGSQLIYHGWTFTGFAETMPPQLAGNGVTLRTPPEIYGPYAGRHVPWLSFAHPSSQTVQQNPEPDCPRFKSARRPVKRDVQWSLPFSSFPNKFDELPTVSVVIPNLRHDMHDGSVQDGDNWLSANLGDYYEWAKHNNSLLIVTFDEDGNFEETGISEETNPFNPEPNARNRIPTIIGGDHLKPGLVERKTLTHVNLLRTIEAIYGLQKSGKQLPYSALSDDFVDGIFQPSLE